MKDFFRKLGYRLQQWMSGRYGMDELSKALNIAALVCLALSVLPWFRFFYGMAFLFWAAAVFRCFSRNITKRTAERSTYFRLRGRAREFFSTRRSAWKDRKTHRYLRCKQCKTTLRVPKNKGTLKIRCPKCGSEIIKKT